MKKLCVYLIFSCLNYSILIIVKSSVSRFPFSFQIGTRKFSFIWSASSIWSVSLSLFFPFSSLSRSAIHESGRSG